MTKSGYKITYATANGGVGSTNGTRQGVEEGAVVATLVGARDNKVNLLTSEEGGGDEVQTEDSASSGGTVEVVW